MSCCGATTPLDGTTIVTTFASETEDIISNKMFAASEQWVGFWTKATEDHVARMQAMTQEWTKLESRSIEQAASAVDEMSKLTEDSFAYTSQLAAEWRKLMAAPLKKTA